MENTRTTCPYCTRETLFELPENYAPVFEDCRQCGKKFIVERLKEGFSVFTLENAPRCSDPDCRAIEMGGSDEQ